MFIAVEGIDGAGKQTLVDALIAALEAPALPDVVSRVAFPRYDAGPFGTAIGAALRADESVLLASVEAMAVMYAADRWHWWTGLDEYYTVCIADRWCASNAAYGSARIRLDGGDSAAFVDWVETFEFGELTLPRPDLTVLLATAERVASDARKQRAPEDAYEATIGLQEHALDTYRGLARRRWGGPWLVLDPMNRAGARRAPDELAAEVVARIRGARGS